jgi:predicted transcriptional regulator
MLDQTTTDPIKLAEITGEIVAAYVSHNAISPTDLTALIDTVARSVATIGAPAELPIVEETHEPAVPVRRSIQPDHLVCLICGKAQKMLKRHLAVRHDLTPAEYRKRFDLKSDYPMAAPDYSEQRRAVAFKTGLGKLRAKTTPKRRAGARKTANSSPAEVVA